MSNLALQMLLMFIPIIILSSVFFLIAEKPFMRKYWYNEVIDFFSKGSFGNDKNENEETWIK
ncbi:MAG: hypothetical protein JXR07_08365 [Reichenbachiella sp.]